MPQHVVESPVSSFSFEERQRPLDQFRAKTRKLEIHPAERRLLWAVAAHLAFMPWALGTMRPWGQWISLGLAVVGIVMALVPRDYSAEHTGAGAFRLIMWPRLAKFPLFWLGLALLAYVTMQALNPAWVYVSDGKVWWMKKVEFNEWLPSGVDAPFGMWGPWRMLIIYAATWLTVCAIWVGFTRRRSVQVLLIAIAANGLAVAGLGVAQKLLAADKIYWFEAVPGATFFGPFVYKNHGGNYLNLVLAIACGLAAWYYLRGLRRLEKSNPSGVFAFFATCLAIAILVSYARGATISMLGFLAGCVVVFLIHQLMMKDTPRRPIVAVALMIVVGYFAKVGTDALNTKEAWKHLQDGLTNQEVSLEDRRIATQATLEMAKETWVRGAGVGSFRFLFPLYQQNYQSIYHTGGTRLFWEHAHNDLVELLAELGVAGLLLLAGGCGYLALALVRAQFWQNPLSGCMVFGALLTVLQAWWDFPFYCPAVLTLWWAALVLALMWARFEETGARA